MFLEHGADKLEDPLVALIIKRNYLCRVCMSQFFPSSRLDRNTCMGSIFFALYFAVHPFWLHRGSLQRIYHGMPCTCEIT